MSSKLESDICCCCTCSRPRAEQLAEEFPEVNVDIRLMDELDASIAECDTIFAGEALYCLAGTCVVSDP
jgi:hypothetical protein